MNKTTSNVISISKEECTDLAKTQFIDFSGLTKEGNKYDKMRNEAFKIRQLIDDRIDLKAVYSYYKDVKVEGNVVTIGGVWFKCNAFEQINASAIKGAYVYMVTAGNYELEDEPISRQIFADFWGTAFADAARKRLAELLSRDSKISEGFGPGFYGMDVSMMKELTKLIDISAIGVEVRESGILLPLKSCGGIYFVVDDSYIPIEAECKSCLGNHNSCNLCSIKKDKQQKIFKCTGLCESCGKCKNANMIAEANDRKKKMLTFPQGFQADNNGEGLGIAFDIGTTTVVGMLWDLKTGNHLGTVAKTNPQNIYGLDVISRITFCNEKEANLSIIRNKIIDCLNNIISQLCKENSLELHKITKVTVAGNTTMSHIFSGYSPSSLAIAPFTPSYTGPLVIQAIESGLNISKNGIVTVIANIAGHVGGDITAGIIATEILEEKELTLFMDIGTNGEIVLLKNGEILACSTASGPAFEGAAIYQGMRAARGAIERVEIQDENVYFKTIENCEPVGICGSGLIDVVCEMLKAGVINNKGRLMSKAEMEKSYPGNKLSERLRDSEFGKEFVLVFKEEKEDIVITQKDIREVQLAKGAIYAGISIMLSKFEESVENINKVVIAGAFGNFINKKSAVAIGMLPQIDIERIYSAGNAAGAGVSMVLVNKNAAETANKIPLIVKHVELATCEEFQDEYLKAMSFKQ